MSLKKGVALSCRVPVSVSVVDLVYYYTVYYTTCMHQQSHAFLVTCWLEKSRRSAYGLWVGVLFLVAMRSVDA